MSVNIDEAWGSSALFSEPPPVAYVSARSAQTSAAPDPKDEEARREKKLQLLLAILTECCEARRQHNHIMFVHVSISLIVAAIAFLYIDMLNRQVKKLNYALYKRGVSTVDSLLTG